MPVSTEGPPEEPEYEQPVAYSEFTEEPSGGPPLPPLTVAPTRWYRQPWALFIFGTITAVVLALVIYAIFELITNQDTQPVDTITTTTAVVVPGPIRTVTETTEVPAETTPETTVAPTQTQTTTTAPTTTTTTEPTTTSPTTTTPTAPPTTTEITITLPRLPLPPLPPPPGP